MIKNLLLQKTNKIHYQFFRYLFVGGVSAVADISIFMFLIKNTETHYQLATIFGFCAGVTVNYLLSNAWVFSREMKTLSKKEHFRDVSTFIFIGIIGLLMTMGVMWFFHEYVGLTELISKILSLIVVVWNFCARKYFVFR